jgi:hypothetical protein
MTPLPNFIVARVEYLVAPLQAACETICAGLARHRLLTAMMLIAPYDTIFKFALASQTARGRSRKSSMPISSARIAVVAETVKAKPVV